RSEDRGDPRHRRHGQKADAGAERPVSLEELEVKVARKMNPISEKKVMVTAPLAALKRRFRNSPTSSSGVDARRSQAMKARSSAAASANPAMLRAAAQPSFGASMIV